MGVKAALHQPNQVTEDFVLILFNYHVIHLLILIRSTTAVQDMKYGKYVLSTFYCVPFFDQYNI